MSSRVRRVCGDGLVSAGVVGAVLAVLVSFDARVREQAQTAFASASPATAADAGARLYEIGSALADAATTQSVEHAPLMIFAVMATVLLLALARS